MLSPLGLVPAEVGKTWGVDSRTPEFKRILREPIPKDPSVNSLVNCEEMVRCKCGWGSPCEFSEKYFETICK
jgi:hypothetical protein